MIDREEFEDWKENRVTKMFMKLLKDDKNYWLDMALESAPKDIHHISRYLGRAAEAQELESIDLEKLNSNS